ncbi:unnamed protein product [Cuscuta europaea]|uniref:Mitochondrial import inner membrane translocase subunit TIM50 n=1 Tax=Cuscuta europaea TaxID=41803 RepID=A0A9P0Z2W2_CUSEU|nr:unnamed protein product [Cuscuta europaea]
MLELIRSDEDLIYSVTGMDPPVNQDLIDKRPFRVTGTSVYDSNDTSGETSSRKKLRVLGGDDGVQGRTKISDELPLDDGGNCRQRSSGGIGKSPIPTIYDPVDISSRKKLLILDVNGLLAAVDRVPAAGRVSYSVTKRPYCDDFLHFCFERFDVAIWSSRIKKKNLDPIVDNMFGELKDKLVFCWDMSYCTRTKFKTLEDKYKPIVFKELCKVWDTGFPYQPWPKGYYNESNTLLWDDSPYKALLNPIHTSIFPSTYKSTIPDDKSLGELTNYRVRTM